MKTSNPVVNKLSLITDIKKVLMLRQIKLKLCQIYWTQKKFILLAELNWPKYYYFFPMEYENRIFFLNIITFFVGIPKLTCYAL